MHLVGSRSMMYFYDLYVKLQRIENLFLEGNVTTLDITEITSEEFLDELFDPQLLQSPS